MLHEDVNFHIYVTVAIPVRARHHGNRQHTPESRVCHMGEMLYVRSTSKSTDVNADMPLYINAQFKSLCACCWRVQVRYLRSTETALIHFATEAYTIVSCIRPVADDAPSSKQYGAYCLMVHTKIDNVWSERTQNFAFLVKHLVTEWNWDLFVYNVMCQSSCNCGRNLFARLVIRLQSRWMSDLQKI